MPPTEKVTIKQTIFSGSFKESTSLATDGELVYVIAGYYGVLLDVMHANGERCCIISPAEFDSYFGHCSISVAEDGNIWIVISPKFCEPDEIKQGAVYCFPPILHSFPLRSFPPPLSYLTQVAVHVHQDCLPLSLLPPRYLNLFPEWRQTVRVEIKPWQLYPDLELALKPGVSVQLVKWMVCHKIDISVTSDMTMVAVLRDGDLAPIHNGSRLHKDTTVICVLLNHLPAAVF